MDWFEELTGFRETGYNETRAKLAVEERQLRSLINGKCYGIGELELVSLARADIEVASCWRFHVLDATDDADELHGRSIHGASPIREAPRPERKANPESRRRCGASPKGDGFLTRLLLGLGFLRCDRRPGGSRVSRSALSRSRLAENAFCAISCSVIAFSASSWRNASRASRSALVIGFGGSNSPGLFVISSPLARVNGSRTFRCKVKEDRGFWA